MTYTLHAEFYIRDVAHSASLLTAVFIESVLIPPSGSGSASGIDKTFQGREDETQQLTCDSSMLQAQLHMGSHQSGLEGLKKPLSLPLAPLWNRNITLGPAY